MQLLLDWNRQPDNHTSVREHVDNNSSFLLGVVAVLAVGINRTIMKPLTLFDALIRSFASGEANLTARMESFSAPEFARLSDNFNAFVTSLQSIIRHVSEVGQQVVSETQSMAHRATHVETLATGQREETEQVATAMTEMTTTATEISSNTSQRNKRERAQNRCDPL